MNRALASNKFLVLALAFLLVATLLPLGALGQLVSANLVGTVYDSSGAVIANAEVEALNVATGVRSTAKATGSGDYRFNNLPVGTYNVTAKASGFGSATKQVVMELNQTGTLNFSLTPGAQSVTVEVSGTPPIIDTTTAQIQTNYEQRETQDLPTASVGLGVLNLSLLQAGVGSSGGLGAGTGPAMSGQRPRDNNFTIEGVDINDKGVTGPGVSVPNDAVANFSVMQNQFSPEFGHSNGGQFNTVVVSGTNQFHGRAYEYNQNRNFNGIDTYAALAAINAGQKPKNPRYDNNRFGGQLGGPIFKNKLFFFANYEYNPVGQSAVGGSLAAPTAAGYTTLAGIPGISTANVGALQKYVQAAGPTNPATSIQVCDYMTVTATPNASCPFHTANTGTAYQVELGGLNLVSPNWNNTGFLTTSMDYNISDKDQIRGRYLYSKTKFIDAAAQLPVFYQTLSSPYHVIAITEYHQFTPMITNEFRVGFNRTGTNWTVPGNISFLGTLDAFPNITIDPLGVNVGPDPNAPQYALQNLYQVVDNVSWTRGNHTLKFGVEGRKYITPQKFIQRSRGDYEYATLDAFANDFAPDGGLAERSFGTVGYSGDQSGIFWYANDTWKLRPNFTINLGLRYEYTGTPYGWTQQSLNSVADAPGLITFGSPKAPKKDFMPRIGFAYSPGTGGNTSIRGGFGLGYDVLYDNIGVLSRPPQIGSTIDCPTQCAATGFLAAGGIPPQPGLTGITTLNQADARALTSSFLPNNVKYPYAISWNLGIQHVFAKDYTAEVRYVGTHGNALNVQNRINVVDVVTPTNYLPTFFSAPSQATLDALPVTLTDLINQYDAGGFFDANYLNAGFFSEIVGFMPWGNSIYHGLQTQLNRRFSNGLQFQAAYTWSHAIDNSTADFFSTIIAPRRPENFRNLPAERSSSILNHTHRLTISAIYDVPWYKHGNWFQKNILGNYEITPVYTYESPQFGTMQSGRDVNLNTDGAGDRIIINPNATSNTATYEDALTNTAGDVVGYIPHDLTAKYVRASTGTLTNSHRSDLPVSPINNWDASLVKHINITERIRVDFLFQLLNAFNHPQYIGGYLDQVNEIGQTGATQRNFFIPCPTHACNSNFNVLKESWSSNPRTTQFGLKFIF